MPAVQETQEMWVWFLGWEDPLEKEMATHSSILEWKIPWSKELGRLQSMGSQKVRHDWATKQHSTLTESSHDITFSEHTASKEPDQNRILSLRFQNALSPATPSLLCHSSCCHYHTLPWHFLPYYYVHVLSLRLAYELLREGAMPILFFSMSLAFGIMLPAQEVLTPAC